MSEEEAEGMGFEANPNSEGMLEAMESFADLAATWGGFRRQVLEQGFHAEAADNLVVMAIGNALQENARKRALEDEERRWGQMPSGLRRLFGGMP